MSHGATVTVPSGANATAAMAARPHRRRPVAPPPAGAGWCGLGPGGRRPGVVCHRGEALWRHGCSL